MNERANSEFVMAYSSRRMKRRERGAARRADSGRGFLELISSFLARKPKTLACNSKNWMMVLR
jgi:hypothetical protein